MATWPANGDSDWNTKMLAYLAVEHTTDGHHKYPVDGTPTEVRTLYLTGTLDSDSTTAAAHGITGINNILSVTAVIFDTGLSRYLVTDYERDNVDATTGFRITYDGTSVFVSGVGTSQQGQSFRIKINYLI